MNNIHDYRRDFRSKTSNTIAHDQSHFIEPCYGSTTSGWGSFPSSDDATFGGSGTDGVIPIQN